MTRDELGLRVGRDDRDYSVSPESFGTKIKIDIRCTKHDMTFKPRVEDYIRTGGGGCPKCRAEKVGENKRLSFSQIVNKSRAIHGDKYEYVEFVPKSTEDIMTIICPDHGEFTQRVATHIHGKCGCQKCAIEVKKHNLDQYNQSNKVYTTDFIKRSVEVFGDRFEYPRTVVVDMKQKVTITCKSHGDFDVYPMNHLAGNICPVCNNEQKLLTTTEFIDRAETIHTNDRYSYKNSAYKSMVDDVTVTCKYHGDFNVKAASFLYGNTGCPKCKSMQEHELFEMIQSLYDGCIKRNDRTAIKPLELDIYLPDLSIAFEFNGLFWHSDENLDKDYHINKLNKCESVGIHLIQIFEDDWLYNRRIVESRLKSLLQTSIKIGARKTKLKQISNSDASKFTTKNHIQGSGAPGSFNYGLYHNGELISVATFGKTRVSMNEAGAGYELYRFSTKLGYTVVGGLSKMIKKFMGDCKPDRLITYADRSWTNFHKNAYLSTGFKLIKVTDPGYYYFDKRDRKREHRFKYRKNVIAVTPDDKAKTEREIMKERGFLRIYDSGNLKFEYIK